MVFTKLNFKLRCLIGMEIYLPMKNRIRTKLKISDKEIAVFQQDRSTFFIPFWKKVSLSPELMKVAATYSRV